MKKINLRFPIQKLMFKISIILTYKNLKIQKKVKKTIYKHLAKKLMIRNNNYLKNKVFYLRKLDICHCLFSINQ